MPIVFTITLPDEGDEGTLLAQKGELAYLMRFKSSSREEILFAMLAAQTEIEALEANPPQVETATAKVDKPLKANSKPAKKKRSLSDVPEDWQTADTEEMPIFALLKPVTKPTTIQVGSEVNLPADLLDVDGDAVGFCEGRILEIEADRAWVESLDGEFDAWLNLTDLSITL